MVHLPFLCFKISRLEALVLLKIGWPVPLNRCTILLAAWLLRHSKYFILFPLNVVEHKKWRWSGPWSLLAWCSLSPSRSGSREKEIMTKSSASRYDELLEIFNLAFPSFCCSWNIFHLSDTKERNQRRHILLPSPTWLLDHWPMLISSMKVTSFSRHSTFRISSECSFINFRVMLNTLQIFSNFVFV